MFKRRRKYCCTSYEMVSDKKKDLHTFLHIITIMLILMIGAVCVIHIDQVCKQQIDTLDQLNYIRQAVEAPEEAAPAGPVSSISLAPDERALVCRVVMSESGDEPFEAQKAVAQTLYDRMNDFGQSLDEAVSVCSTKDNGDPTDSVKLAVANVFDGGIRVYVGGTYQFHDTSADPYWTTGKIDRGSIGNLRFYGGYVTD